MWGKVYRSIWSSVLPAGPPPRGLLADWTGKRSRSPPPSPACPSGCCREAGPGLPPSGAASPGTQESSGRRWDGGGMFHLSETEDLSSLLSSSYSQNRPLQGWSTAFSWFNTTFWQRYRALHLQQTLFSIKHCRLRDAVKICSVQFYLNVAIEAEKQACTQLNTWKPWWILF